MEEHFILNVNDTEPTDTPFVTAYQLAHMVAEDTNKQKKLKENDYYQTPEYIHKPLMEWLGLERFSCDPCSPMEPQDYNIQADIRYTEVENGLIHPWGEPEGHVLLNPPYSQYEEWVHKAIQESKRGVFVWALLNQSNASIWQDYINPEMQFKISVRQRIKFINVLTGKTQNSPRYDNFIVHFGPDERYKNLLRSRANGFPIPGEMQFGFVKVGQPNVESSNE